MSTKFRNTVLGAVSVLVKDSNHNSDFDGKPRMIGNKLSASDKSIKYYVRRFLETCGHICFYKKTTDSSGKINTIDNRVSILGFKTLLDYFKCIDIKFFGATILSDKLKGDTKKKIRNMNFSLHGTLQVSYGGNISGNEDYSNNSIISQFPSNADATQTTIGNQHKVVDANYIHNFTLYPLKLERDNLMSTDDFKDNIPFISVDDVESIKEAFSHCIGSAIDGSFKSDSKNNTKVGLVVYITLKEGIRCNISIHNTITTPSHGVYDLSKLIETTEKHKEHIELVDIAYTENDASICTEIPNDSMYNVSTCGYIIK